MTINELLHVTRYLYKQEQDPLIKAHYLELGLTIKRLLEEYRLLLYDDFDDPETVNFIFSEMKWRH